MLLDLEGLEILFFLQFDPVYPPSVSLNSIFFSYAIFWRDIGKILWKFVIFVIWHEKQSASRVRLWTSNEKKW